jgi:hypothetical protein
VIRVRTVEPRRCRLALSLLVWALCALLGPGPALPALHFSLVQHRICPEHGELLHVDEAGSARDASSSVGASPAVEQSSATDVASAAQGAGDSTTDGHDHDACGVSVLGSVAAVWPAAQTTLAAVAEQGALRRAGAERAHLRIALLDYAPKLEPPSPEHLRLSLDASVLV